MVDTAGHAVVSRETWIEARKALLAEEKAFTRQRDALSAKRRALPWVGIDQDYVFEGPDGAQALADLFDGRRQLIVYHFMFGSDWETGCPSCSFWADNFDPAIIHLNQRDATMIAVSRAPLDKLQAFRKRMGWQFKWVSSFDNTFNRDFNVSFSEDELAAGPVYYNYAAQNFPATEAPGVSVFIKADDGAVFHTYSCFGRGLDMLNGAYQHLDLLPRGRDEDALDFSMAWVRRHDEYEDFDTET